MFAPVGRLGVISSGEFIETLMGAIEDGAMEFSNPELRRDAVERPAA